MISYRMTIYNINFVIKHKKCIKRFKKQVKYQEIFGNFFVFHKNVYGSIGEKFFTIVS